MRVHRSPAGRAKRLRNPGDVGASWVGGGMCAPHSEGWPGEEQTLLQMGLESLRLWHDGFTGRPARRRGDRPRITGGGRRPRRATSTVAHGGGLAGRPGHPVAVTTAARDVNPSRQGIRHGFRAVDEIAVDNRKLVRALAEEQERLGVRWAGPVGTLDEAHDVADDVVIANRIDAPALWPGPRFRPVKGEILRLRWRPGCTPVPQRVVRARTGRPVYLVPRADGGGRRHPVRARPRHRAVGDRRAGTPRRRLRGDAEPGEYEVASARPGCVP